MPILDMPIKEMEVYLGCNPYPEDFDGFWKSQKHLADNIELKYVLIEKKNLNEIADYYEIIFESFDGAKIYAKYLCPKVNEEVPTVLEFHDYKERSKSWHYLTRYIGIGYSVVAMDCRGQGGKSEDVGQVKGSTVSGHLINGLEDEADKMYYCKVYLDGYILSRIVEKLKGTDVNKIISFGKGQGASLALAVAYLNKNIKKCSLQYPFLCDFKRVWDMDLDMDAYEGIRYYFKWFDPMHIKENDIFTKLGYIDGVNFAKGLKCEVLVGTALLDKVTPPSTQFALYNNLKCKKKHVIFPKYGHELNNFFENENLLFMKL